MDSGDVRIEDLDATSTTLIMRGLNRQTTREMLQTLLDETAPRPAMYNYIYVPWTTDGASNIGLAFANFESPFACQEYLFGLTHPDNKATLAKCHVRSIGPAAIQGRGANLTAMLAKRGHEALRGFDAPMVFNQGLKAPLVEVADQEVPGGLAQALARAKAVSTNALASPYRSRRHASSLNSATSASSWSLSFNAAPKTRGYPVWDSQREPAQAGPTSFWGAEPDQSLDAEMPYIRVQVPHQSGAGAVTKIIFDL